ncbi:MAG: serine/threonine protein kinase, partial [Myxococcota bacterium]|nr:serine/threonine protein kinase [Myxococcota bacterium]
MDQVLGVEPRVYGADDDDATIVLPREAAMPEDPTPPPVTDSTPSSTELPATEPVEVSSGVVIDQRYRVQRLVGRGGIGLVYLCHHEVLEKPVAMKVLRPEYADQPEVIERFVNEARAASAIKSKHIVNTLDIGSLPSGAPYFIMEHVDAETLASILQARHALPVAEAVEVVRQMADGLGAAHTAGIVHRDLKPENVFVGRESDGSTLVKIFDFGVAKVTRARSRLTHVGAIFGTPSYMSPEQARGQAVDPRADIYALGIMLFEMLAGHLPFDGDDPLAVMAQHVDAPVPPLKTPAGEAVPLAVEAVVRRCLEKNRDDRYPSVAELLADLQDAEHAPSGPQPLPASAAHPDHEAHPDLLLRDSQLPEIVVPLEEVAVAAPAVSPRPAAVSPRPAAVAPRAPVARSVS